MQPGQTFEVSIVSPACDHDPSWGHILIHQGIDRRHRSILLSTFRHSGHSQMHARRALVVPKRITCLDLPSFSGFQTECQHRNFLCVSFFGSESLDETRPLFPSHGDHFDLHLVDWDLVPTTAVQKDVATESDDPDALSFMQPDRHRFTRAPRICGIDLPAQTPENSPFQFQVNAPVFVPGIPWDLHTHDEFVQDLFESWNQIAIEWENEERSSLVLVWFVDHQWTQPHGQAPRTVKLFPDLHAWRFQPGQAWQDQVIPGHELEYVLVTPKPYTVDRRVAAHVVIIQRPNEQWVTSVVSLFDERTLQTTVSQLAITTHEHILLDNLARVFGIFAACFGQEPTLLCHAWYKDLALAVGTPIPGRSGMSINLLVRPRPRPIAQPDLQEPDEQSMLTRPCPSLPSEVTPSESQWSPQISSCKITDTQDSEGPDRNPDRATQLTPVPIPAHAAAPVGIPNYVFDMLTDLQPHMLRTDGAQQGFVVRVWYIHHIHLRIARIARYLHLSGPPHMWQPRIVALWSDRLIPFEAIAIHLVKPRPHRSTHEQSIAFDLIVSQGVTEPRRSGLITVFPSNPDPTFPQFAVAVSFRPQVSGEWLIRKLALLHVCQVNRCLIFHRWTEIPQSPDLVHDMTDGDSFDIHIYRDRPGPAEQPMPQQAAYPAPAVEQPAPEQLHNATGAEENEGPTLLQLSRILHLETPSQNDEVDGSLPETPIRLIGLGELHGAVPSFLSLAGQPNQTNVLQELQCFGHSCEVAIAANHTLAICIPASWPFDVDKLLILFTDIHQTFPAEDSAFMTLIDQTDLTEVQMMALLHKFGFEKAVICETTLLHASFLEITFQQAGGTLVSAPLKEKTQKPWPERPYGDRTKNRPMWQDRSVAELPTCFLDLGLSHEDLNAFFHCENDYLCQITEGLPLPAVTTEAIATLKNHSHFDRLIIYADGSSQSRHKHVAPALNEELDVPDAWCFVVLGETIVGSGACEYTLIGWQAHQVRYDTTHPWHIGAQHIGSAIAEREALTWAFI